jgi:hypothetical protein
MNKSQIVDNNEAQKMPKFPYLSQTNKPNKTNGGFERLSASRSSATNLFPSGLSLSTPNQNSLRSSFNSHQSYSQIQQQQQQNGAKVNGNSTIEYASFNIKPSQYKQTGIFLPINNNTQNNNGQKPIGFTANNKQQVNLIRQIKEDLELLIQKLRYLQKNRTSSPNSLGSTVSLEQFLGLAEDFNEKCTQQLNLIGLLSNESNNTNLISIQEHQLQLRQLQSGIKQNCANMQQIDGNSDAYSQLSKCLNEFMQCLDKLNNLFSNSMK